jgi:hypothetical protein
MEGEPYMSIGRPKGSQVHKVIMLNIKTGKRIEVWGMPAAARLAGYSVSKVQRLIETGQADKNGWTFDVEEI